MAYSDIHAIDSLYMLVGGKRKQNHKTRPEIADKIEKNDEKKFSRRLRAI